MKRRTTVMAGPPQTLFDVIRNVVSELERTAESPRDDLVNQALLGLLVAVEHEWSQRKDRVDGD